MIEEFEAGDYEDSPRDNFISRSNHKSSSSKSNKRSDSFKRKILLFLLLSGAIFILYTFVFNSATITLTPRVLDKKIKDSYLLINTDAQGQSGKSFEVVTLEKTIEKDVPRSEKKKVLAKASGKLTIYNNFGADPQKLVKNTRFESTSGKVFRISDTVTVPAKINGVMGKIEVKVTADSVGESYNIPESNFTIPGFKGSARYEGFYAVSSSNMSGGADGEKSIVSKEDIESATNDMTIEVKDKIREEIVSAKKENFLSLKDSIFYTITDNLSAFESGKDDKFKIFAKGQMILVNESELAKAIISKEDSDYKKEDVYIRNIADINLKITKTDNLMLNATSLALFIDGEPSFVYNTDIENLKQDIAGKDNTDATFSSTLSKYATVNSAKSKISPFWASSYPKNKNKIKIIVDLGAK